MRVLTGLHGGEDASTVPRHQWHDLVRAREMHCNRSLRQDCRALVFYVEDAAANDWLGFADRDAYVRDGLGLDPELVAWAVDGLRRLDGEHAVTFEAAVVMGVRARELRAQGKKQREIAAELGVSQQRVSQVTSPTSKASSGNRHAVSLHPDPARAAATIIKARGPAYARELASAISAWRAQ